MGAPVYLNEGTIDKLRPLKDSNRATAEVLTQRFPREIVGFP